ncbi:MAG TPA: hypothetical protein VFC82_04640 [Actinomycetaceae bacterium]|nr:hypothetical protein [Actinomycetaceae bacterium]
MVLRKHRGSPRRRSLIAATALVMLTTTGCGLTVSTDPNGRTIDPSSRRTVEAQLRELLLQE